MTLALITGRGMLPALVAKAQSVQPLVCAYEGAAPEGLVADVTFRLETLGSLLVTLGEKGITEVCLVGALDRPALDPSKLDSETKPLVPLFMAALEKGDDGALKVILELFEKTGFIVRAAHDLAPYLLAEGGVYGEVWPDAQMRGDSRTGAAYLEEIGPKDIGQACVVVNGKIVGMEDAKGTDALIERFGTTLNNKNAILVKAPKPDQTRLIDLPAIGPDTIERAGKAGFAGVVIDAGDVLVIDKARCVTLADQYGLVLWARTGG